MTYFNKYHLLLCFISCFVLFNLILLFFSSCEYKTNSIYSICIFVLLLYFTYFLYFFFFTYFLYFGKTNTFFWSCFKHTSPNSNSTLLLFCSLKISLSLSETFQPLICRYFLFSL